MFSVNAIFYIENIFSGTDVLFYVIFLTNPMNEKLKLTRIFLFITLPENQSSLLYVNVTSL